MNPQELVSKAVAFARNLALKVARIDARAYQAAIATVVFRTALLRLGQTITILISRQGGKNETLITWIILPLAMLMPGIRIGFYAPTFNQATHVTMRRLKARLKHPKFDGRLAIANDKLVQFALPKGASGPYAHRGEGSLIGVFSHEPDAKKEGFTWDVIVIDEAQDLDRETFEVEIEPMGASTDASYVFIGTPWSIDCIFYDKIQAAKAKGLHFEFDWKAVAACSAAYAKFIAKKLEDLGAESIAFLTQYALQWVAAVGKFFDPDLWPTYGRTNRAWRTSPEPGKEYAAGLDVAGDDPNNTGKTDFTVLAIVEVDRSKMRTKDDMPDTCLVNYVAWRGKDWERQYGDVVALLRHWKPRMTVVDATGMGDPFSDRIEKAGFEVERLKYTEQSKSDLGHLADQEIGAGRSTYATGTPDATAKAKLAELDKQARALVRVNRKQKRIAFHVPEDKGHDDVIMAWFNAIRAATLGGLSAMAKLQLLTGRTGGRYDGES
jgi:hypothetical protein